MGADHQRAEIRTRIIILDTDKHGLNGYKQIGAIYE
jgi:hypothetical protein